MLLLPCIPFPSPGDTTYPNDLYRAMKNQHKKLGTGKHPLNQIKYLFLNRHCEIPGVQMRTRQEPGATELTWI